jgi:hypothetical protein
LCLEGDEIVWRYPTQGGDAAFRGALVDIELLKYGIIGISILGGARDWLATGEVKPRSR